MHVNCGILVRLPIVAALGWLVSGCVSLMPTDESLQKEPPVFQGISPNSVEQTRDCAYSAFKKAFGYGAAVAPFNGGYEITLHQGDYGISFLAKAQIEPVPGGASLIVRSSFCGLGQCQWTKALEACVKK